MNGRGTAVALVAALVVAMLIPACTSQPAPRAPAAPAPAARAADPELESRALLLLLADRRLYEPIALERMLGAAPAVREALAVALGRIGDPRGRSLLQGLLVDHVVEVRRAAAFALGELGLPAAAEARRALVVAAVDDDEEVGALAVEALGKLGAPLAEVRRALGALAPAAAARRLAPFLFRFEETEMVAAARAALAGDDAESGAVRRGGAYALGRAARPEGLEALRALLTDRDPFVRAWAARGLGEVGGLEDLGRLEPGLADPDPSVTIQTLRAGGKILGRTPALPPFGWGTRLAALADSPAPGVRAAMLEVAGRFLPHPELETAVRRSWSEGEPRERELALLAMVAGPLADAPARVAEAAASDDRWLRARAAEAAGEIGDLDLLDRLRRDRQPVVRIAALGALAAADARPPLLEALADPDPAVRATALDALALAPELETSRVVAMIAAAGRDGAADDVRRSGIAVLEQRGKQWPERELAPALEALRALALEADWSTRRAAAGALAELGEPRPPIGPVATGRDLAAYRELLRQAERPRRVDLVTERGTLELELACPEAPLTCLSFLQLAGAGFFDGTRFHRVVADFVVQGGDPRGDGWGGPGYALRDEINRLRYRRGALGMALSGPDTGGSQFFLTLAPQPHLDGGYTVFGRLVGGDEVLDRLRQGDRILSAREVERGAGGLR